MCVSAKISYQYSLHLKIAFSMNEDFFSSSLNVQDAKLYRNNRKNKDDNIHKIEALKR